MRLTIILLMRSIELMIVCRLVLPADALGLHTRPWVCVANALTFPVIFSTRVYPSVWIGLQT